MRDKLILFLASGLGLGYAPIVPGTFGTLLGVMLAVFLPDNLTLIGLLAVGGIWLANEAEKALQEHDSPRIVIDEIAGYMIAAYGWHNYNLIIAFVLFRALDIIKPFPIGRLQRLPGGLGIMADDLLAGLVTNLLMIGAYRIFVAI